MRITLLPACFVVAICLLCSISAAGQSSTWQTETCYQSAINPMATAEIPAHLWPSYCEIKAVPSSAAPPRDNQSHMRYPCRLLTIYRARSLTPRLRHRERSFRRRRQ